MRSLASAILFLALSLSVVTPVQAFPLSICSRVANLAEGIMRWRQDGVRLEDILKNSGGANYFQAMAIEAFSKQRYLTAEYQDLAVEYFREDYYLACVKDAKKEDAAMERAIERVAREKAASEKLSKKDPKPPLR